MRPLFRSRTFLCLWLATSLSAVGDHVFAVAFTWHILELTESALRVSVAWIVDALPVLLLGAYAGRVADRVNRLHTLVAVNLAMALPFALAMPALLGQSFGVAHTYLLLFALSLVGTLKFPLASALLVDFVPAEQLQRANALFQTSNNAARLLGPALGGLLIAWKGVASGFAADGASFLLAGLILLLMPAAGRGKQERAGTETAGARVGAATAREAPAQGLWAAAWGLLQDPVLRGLLILTCAGQFFTGPLTVLLPTLVRVTLNAGARELGLMMSLLGAGAVLAGVAMLPRRFSERALARRVLPGALAGTALGTALVAASPVMAVVGAGALAWGFFDGVAEVALLTVTQTALTPGSRGLFFGLLASTLMATRQVGMGVSGAVADAVGVRAAILACAAGLLPTLLLALARPMVRAPDHPASDLAPGPQA